MKKVLSLAVVCAMSISFLSFSFSVNGESASPLLMDFDSPEAISAVTSPGSPDTRIDYDDAVGAMRVAAVDGNRDGEYLNPGRVEMGNIVGKAFAQSLKASDYPVIAMRVKLNNPLSKSWYAHYRTDTSVAAAASNQAYDKIKYASTNDWQLLVMDLRTGLDKNYLSGIYDSLMFTFFEGYAPSAPNYTAANTAISTKDIVWVDWIGVFASQDEAKSCAGQQTASPMLWDFTGTTNVVNDTANYTDLSYDAVTGGLKVGTKLVDGISLNPARIGLNSGASQFPNGISMTEYPVVALRVKLNKADSKGWYMHFKTTANTAMNGNGIMNYADTTEWQTLILDMREGASSAAVGGNWTRITFTFFEGNGGAGQSNAETSVNDIIWVDWVGLFASKSAAQGYINGTTPLIMDFESAGSVPSYSKSPDTQITYDESAKALKVSAVDDGNKTWNNPARIEFYSLPFNDVAVSEYPYLAIRFKMSRPDIKGWYFHFRTDKSEAAVAQNPKLSVNYALANPTYTETDGWQTIVVNANDAIDKDLMNNNLGVTDSSGWGNWVRFIFTFMNAAYTQQGDCIWIDWAGAFKTLEDAAAYKPAYKINVSSAANGNVIVSEGKSAEGQKIRVTAIPNEGYQLKADGLNISWTIGGVTYNRKLTGAGDTSVRGQGGGQVFEFTMPAANVTVTPSFISRGTTNINILGAGIRIQEPSGLRFLTRLYVANQNQIYVDGNAYTIDHYGTLLSPQEYLGELELTHDRLAETVSGTSKPIAKDQVSAVLYNEAGMYGGQRFLDFTVVIINLPDNRRYSARGYVAYRDGNDQLRYIYSNTMSCSIQDIYSVID